MAIRARLSQGGRNETHGRKELVDRNPLQRLNILECLVGRQWFWLLASQLNYAQQANDRSPQKYFPEGPFH
jgi:hypothetical protein